MRHPGSLMEIAKNCRRTIGRRILSKLRRILLSRDQNPFIRFLLPIWASIAPQKKFHMKILADETFEGINKKTNVLIAY